MNFLASPYEKQGGVWFGGNRLLLWIGHNKSSPPKKSSCPPPKSLYQKCPHKCQWLRGAAPFFRRPAFPLFLLVHVPDTVQSFSCVFFPVPFGYVSLLCFCFRFAKLKNEISFNLQSLISPAFLRKSQHFQWRSQVLLLENKHVTSQHSFSCKRIKGEIRKFPRPLACSQVSASFGRSHSPTVPVSSVLRLCPWTSFVSVSKALFCSSFSWIPKETFWRIWAQRSWSWGWA